MRPSRAIARVLRPALTTRSRGGVLSNSGWTKTALARVLGSNRASRLPSTGSRTALPAFKVAVVGVVGTTSCGSWRAKVGAAQHTGFVARGAKLPRVAGFGQQDRRSPRSDHRGAAPDCKHGIRLEALQLACRRFNRMQGAVRLNACDHAGTPIAHRVADEVERRALPDQRIAAEDHSAIGCRGAPARAPAEPGCLARGRAAARERGVGRTASRGRLQEVPVKANVKKDRVWVIIEVQIVSPRRKPTHCSLR